MIMTINCRYNFVEEVGSGSYGNVWKAVSKQSGEVVRVAIFKLNKLLPRTSKIALMNFLKQNRLLLRS